MIFNRLLVGSVRIIDPLAQGNSTLQLPAALPAFIVGTAVYGIGLRAPGGGPLGVRAGALISAVLLIIMAVLFALPALLLIGYLMLVFR